MSKKGSAGKIVAGVLATAIVGGTVGGTVAYFQDETFPIAFPSLFSESVRACISRSEQGAVLN